MQDLIHSVSMPDFMYTDHMKYMGIDYGTKRIGIAVSDDGGTIAFPRVVIQNTPKLFTELLDIIKSEFLTACSTAGIPDSCISIYSYDGFNNYLWSKRKKAKDAELLTSITFQVKFSSSIQMDKLIEKLDDEATKSFDIENTSHSRMTEYRKQVKVQAIKAARDKAVYLLEAIGEKPVVLVSVTELDEPVFPTTYYQYNSLYNNNYQDSMNSPSTDIIFKKIKIRSEVQVVYSIR